MTTSARIPRDAATHGDARRRSSTRVFGPTSRCGSRRYDGSGRPAATTRRCTCACATTAGGVLPATAPGTLGLARAYVQGDLEVERRSPGQPLRASCGCIEDELAPAPPCARELPRAGSQLRLGLRIRELPPRRRRRSELRRLARSASRTAAPATPSAINHHYDVSNRFYELVLGPSMTYTCACYPTAGRDPRAGPGAQVRPGRAQARAAGRACDCSTSAAAGAAWCATPSQHYGVTALGVTLSREQARWGAERIEARRARRPRPRCGTATTATCAEGDFDAVSVDRADRAHRGDATTRRTSRSCATSCAPAVGCSTTASPARTTSTPGCRGAASSAATCSRTAS